MQGNIALVMEGFFPRQSCSEILSSFGLDTTRSDVFVRGMDSPPLSFLAQILITAYLDNLRPGVFKEQEIRMLAENWYEFNKQFSRLLADLGSLPELKHTREALKSYFHHIRSMAAIVKLVYSGERSTEELANKIRKLTLDFEDLFEFLRQSHEMTLVIGKIHIEALKRGGYGRRHLPNAKELEALNQFPGSMKSPPTAASSLSILVLDWRTRLWVSVLAGYLKDLAAASDPRPMGVILGAKHVGLVEQIQRLFGKTLDIEIVNWHPVK